MKREVIFNWSPANGIIITCPGCGYENKLSELVFDLVQDRVEARCTGKNCEWRIRIMFGNWEKIDD